MKIIVFILSLFASLALAQTGVCKTGADCTNIRKLKTLGSVNLGNGCVLVNTGAGTTQFSCAPFMATNQNFSSGANSILSWGAGFVSMGVGSAAIPQVYFSGDTNNGFYSPAADNIGVTTNGTRSFVFNATAGVLEGPTTANKLTLGATSSLTTADSTVSAGTSNVTLNPGSGYIDAFGPLRNTTASVGVTVDDPDGFQLVGVIATAMAGRAKAFQSNSTDGRVYWAPTTPTAQTPPIDIGGFPHPVMQRHVFGLDMGFESSATPTFYPATPRLGGASATVTVVDAAASATQAIGANPVTYDARTSVTTAAIASISTVITSAFIRRATQSPRWCQKVSLSTAANIRVWLGIASALPGSNDSPATSHEAFRYSTTAGDSKWQACYGNGVGTTCVDTGVAPSALTTTFDTLCIDCIEGGTTACVWWVNGVAKLRQTAGLGAGYPLLPFYSVEARAASAVTLYAGNSSVELW